MSQHGTMNRYAQGCRCDECKEVRRIEGSRIRQEQYAYTAEHGGPPPGIPHSASTYQNWGCRCQVCREASAAKSLRRKQQANGNQ